MIVIYTSASIEALSNELIFINDDCFARYSVADVQFSACKLKYKILWVFLDHRLLTWSVHSPLEYSVE